MLPRQCSFVARARLALSQDLSLVRVFGVEWKSCVFQPDRGSGATASSPRRCKLKHPMQNGGIPGAGIGSVHTSPRSRFRRSDRDLALKTLTSPSSSRRSSSAGCMMVGSGKHPLGLLTRPHPRRADRLFRARLHMRPAWRHGDVMALAGSRRAMPRTALAALLAAAASISPFFRRSLATDCRHSSSRCGGHLLQVPLH